MQIILLHSFEAHSILGFRLCLRPGENHHLSEHTAGNIHSQVHGQTLLQIVYMYVNWTIPLPQHTQHSTQMDGLQFYIISLAVFEENVQVLS